MSVVRWGGPRRRQRVEEVADTAGPAWRACPQSVVFSLDAAGQRGHQPDQRRDPDKTDDDPPLRQVPAEGCSTEQKNKGYDVPAEPDLRSASMEVRFSDQAGFHNR